MTQSRGEMISEAAQLSRLLYEAREEIDMWRVVVENRTGERAGRCRDLIERIDRYRREQGWNPDGYGGETGE